MSKLSNQNKRVVLAPSSKEPFKKPKLTYIEPKLNKQGKVASVTQSFFGSFSP